VIGVPIFSQSLTRDSPFSLGIFIYEIANDQRCDDELFFLVALTKLKVENWRGQNCSICITYVCASTSSLGAITSPPPPTTPRPLYNRKKFKRNLSTCFLCGYFLFSPWSESRNYTMSWVNVLCLLTFSLSLLLSPFFLLIFFTPSVLNFAIFLCKYYHILYTVTKKSCQKRVPSTQDELCKYCSHCMLKKKRESSSYQVGILCYVCILDCLQWYSS